MTFLILSSHLLCLFLWVVLTLSIARASNTSKSDFFTTTTLFREPTVLAAVGWNKEWTERKLHHNMQTVQQRHLYLLCLFLVVVLTLSRASASNTSKSDFFTVTMLFNVPRLFEVEGWNVRTCKNILLYMVTYKELYFYLTVKAYTDEPDKVVFLWLLPAVNKYASWLFLKLHTILHIYI